MRTKGSEPQFDAATVLVTGAAGGIGRALVEAFAARGARVIAGDVRADGLDQLAAGDDRIVPVVADIATAAGADALILACGDRLDVLCNNAAITGTLGFIDEIDDDEFEAVLGVNLTGTFRLCRRAVPLMLEAGTGAIINIASIAGLRGGRSGLAYTASKFGVVGLTQNIASSLAHDGVRCNAICPGSVATGFGSGVHISARALQLRERDSLRPIPGEPEMVADVAIFLASEAARYVNGAVIAVDGGHILPF
ncbi:MAG: SDR family NAD(P)-dependent oxidoreductase [Acidimicrobiia bacterium]